MGKLKEARKIMFTIILLAITARVILWAIGPLIPYMVSGIILIAALGFIFSIMWRKSSKL